VKLSWLNGQHIKKLSPEAAHELFLKFYPEVVAKAPHAARLSALIQGKVEKPCDIPAMIGFLLQLDENFSAELFVHQKNKTTKESCKATLGDLQGRLAALPAWDYASIYAAVSGYATEKALKIGPVMWPLRIALSGLAVTPTGAVEIAELLGKEESLRRIALAIGRL
jgi:glutamyl-tRNA synthetase